MGDFIRHVLVDVLALVLIFGGGVTVALAFSPVGRALAERIRGRRAAQLEESALRPELDQLHQEIAELQERLDFAERLLARRPDAGLPAGGGA